MNKQIDDIFKKNLKNYRQPVPGDVWNNIELALNQKKKTRAYFIYKLSAAASILVIFAFTLFFTLQNTNRNSITEKNSSQSEQQILKTEIKPGIINQNIAITEVNDEKILIQESKSILTNEIESNTALSESNQQNELYVEKIEKLIAKSISINSSISVKYLIKNHNYKEQEIPNLLLADNFKNDKKKSPVKWIIGGEFAPSYSYRYLSGYGNDLEKTYFNSVETPVTSYSGGINIQVVLHKRLSVQSGIYYASIGQNIDHLNVYSNKAFDQVEPKYQKDLLNTFTLSNSIGTVEFNSRYIFVDETNFRINIHSENKYFFDASDPTFEELNAEIQQNLEYIEIPLYLNYKLIDRKIDLNITGGVGANVLVGNNVYLIQGNNSENIGKTNGVNTFNYSGTFALGIDVPLLRNLSFRLQPSVKYYLNAINSDSEIESHPYSFAVFSGVNFSL